MNLKHPSFTFNLNWMTGELKAIGYTSGEKITEFTRTKQGKPAQIKVEFNINNQPFYAGGSDIRLVHAYVLDENGEVVTSANNKISFSISGEGVLVDNGKIDVNPGKLYNGVASIYIKGTGKIGKITVTAKASGLKSGTASISTPTYNTNEIVNNAKPIYDFPISKVDIGGKKQLVQFDWQEWTGTSNENLKYSLKDYNADIEISSENKINWLGDTAMLGDLSFVGTDGVYVEKGTLNLKISNLKAGSYAIETFHHSRRGSVKMTNNIEVTVNDENGKFARKSDDHIVDYYIQDNTGERAPLSIKSYFKADGKSPVILNCKNLKEDGDMWINGLILKQVK